MSLILLLLGAAFSSVAIANRVMPDRSEDSSRLAAEDFRRIADSGHWVGDADAPVILVVFNDYGCGYCASFHETLDVLAQRYPQHLALVFAHFVPDDRSPTFVAALGAECAAQQGRFEEFQRAAFADQRLTRYSTGWQEIAESAGVADEDAFRDCVRSRRFAALVRAQTGTAQQLGIDGTPAYLVNGLLYSGAAPVSFVDSLIARELPKRGDDGDT